MSRNKVLNSIMSFLMVFSLLFGGITPANAQQGKNSAEPARVKAMPAGPTDQTKVPHYFGPYPNWANSPFTLPNAAVEIQGDGSGATAVALVDPVSQGIASIQVTAPGSGYTTANVVISGGDGTATATATVNPSGIVTSVNVDAAGGGYSSPQVSFSGGGATADATGIAYGSVDAVTIVDGGSGYTMPTVDFDLPDDPNGVTAKAHADMDVNGTITAVVIDDPGSGYLTAPGVAIHNGTLFDPIAGATLATVSSTLKITSVVVDTFGNGYTSAPAVAFSDLTGVGSGASATAFVDIGGVTGVTVTNPGAGYLTVGMHKFIDDLPGLCQPPSCPASGKYIPLGVPEAKVYNGIEADEYVIGLVQYRTSFSSDLPPTLVRGYVQLETAANAGISQHFPLQNELLNGTFVDTGYFGVTPPQWLGPIISATKDKPVRIVFRNLLPTGADGDLFLPVDSSMMGSGMGPMMMMDPMDQGTVMDAVRNPPCSEYPKDGMNCFKDNRATLHLHGGNTPWISDGTPHQWITPASEMTSWPQGVSVVNVPDMNVCDAADDGCQTFYYTNQQSARLLFYHDHSWGITRLNVYAGEAAGYLISDSTEQALLASGAIPADQIPLIIQDRTFVPDAAQLALQDPTWDAARWGTKGSFWYHHVYMPAQNPGDPSGMSAYGRWMYGPWFWPPAAATVYGPIDNPYYDPNCSLDNPATWQYQTDPFCEPQQIPGTPNISVGMEQFNDTPVVNGVAYPKVTLEPKSYRLRILNAANDRFWNLQWYIADPTQGNGTTEVALKQAELDAAQTDPNVFPTPDTSSTRSPVGPSWIQIGTEGGFLPAPAVIPNQPITWITDPTRFDFGNVDQHSLLLAPAERADVIVDFSRFAGKTLILYNDAPAAFPARVASYDYYTGAPDLRPVGAPAILPGYGPNTRTIMQVTIAGTAAPAFNLTKLRNAFKHNANGTGAFESGQHPIIVGQAAYNSAYGTSFAASSNCNAPGSTLQRCDGLVRVNDTSTFGFNTLRSPAVKMTMPLQPKAIHDEMNASTFDEYGRMTANLGVEAQPPSPGLQNVTLYPYVNPSTELIDGTNLPKVHVIYDANGLPVNDVKITPISNAIDGTQIWRITHNGVDTHPIHFHLYDVQVVNRVTWDNIIIPTEPNELGWKDTVRTSPLEDTIVALRPIIPEVPWELPNSIRNLNPMMPTGSQAMFNNIDPQGNPTANITNQLVNFGWEYVYHCHILSHEEMDMMRPVSLALPPNKPDGLAAGINGSGQLVLSWNDNSINETSFLVQRTEDTVNWVDLGTIQAPLDQPNIHEARAFTDTAYQSGTFYQYRVVAKNTVGYGAEFPALTVQSISNILTVGTQPPPAAPSALTVNLVAVPPQLGVQMPLRLGVQSPLQILGQVPLRFGAQAQLLSGPQVQLQWTDNSLTETGFTIERCTGVGCTNFAPIDGVGTDAITYTDPTIAANTSYSYRVFAFSAAGNSATSNVATIAVPAAPTVVSIMRASPNPTNAASVDYTVTFSAAVAGVDVADFGLTTTGTIAGASVASVTGTGATRTVTVGTGTGSGTLALQVLGTATITDLVGNQLTGLPFSTPNQEYVIQPPIPTVVSIVRASPNPTNAASVDYTVTFSEAVTGVDTTDFAITAGGLVANPYVVSVSQPNPAQPIFTVSVNTGTGSGTLRLDLIDNDSILSAAFAVPLGGPGAQNFTTGEVYDLDKLAPSIVSIVRASVNPTNAASVDYTVTFSEAVSGVDAADFALNVTGGVTGAAVANVSGSGTTYTITVNAGTGSGTLRLDVPGTATVADLVGNALAGLPFSGGEVYDIDKTAPTVVSIVRASANPTFAASVDYTVTFSEAVSGVDAADFAVSVTGASVGSVASVNGSGTTYTVTVNNGTGRGTLRLDMPGTATVADLVGNALAGLPFSGGEVYTTLPVMGIGAYDDANAAWTYNGTWLTFTGTGPANNTLHYTNASNASATFAFQGPARFILTYTATSNRGNILVSVDGGTPITINAYSRTTRWQQTYTGALYLDSGRHMVTVSTPGTGTYIDVDAVQIASAPTPMGIGIYDDTDPAWSYLGSWTAYTGSGPYNNTLHYTNAGNASATFAFQAPARFILTYTAAPNRGNILVSVDGGTPTMINARSQTTRWQQTYSSALYADNGIHTVTLSTPGTGTYIDVDAITISNGPLTVTAGTYDDTHPAWTFSSGWTAYTGTGPYNSTDHFTNVVGNDAQITFNGTRFTLTYVRASNRGLIDVYVDGTKVGTINANGTTTSWQRTWTSPTFTAGSHTVRFVNAGSSGTYIDVDAITITP